MTSSNGMSLGNRVLSSPGASDLEDEELGFSDDLLMDDEDDETDEVDPDDETNGARVRSQYLSSNALLHLHQQLQQSPPTSGASMSSTTVLNHQSNRSSAAITSNGNFTSVFGTSIASTDDHQSSNL
jgi:hypothetical protein